MLFTVKILVITVLRETIQESCVKPQIMTVAMRLTEQFAIGETTIVQGNKETTDFLI